MAHVLTRAELHALVWDRPMTRLAAEYGLSDVALHKICRKHDVPTPPAGYWQKKAHGKPVSIAPLPRPEETGRITIREGEASNEGVEVAEARAGVRAALAGWQPTGEPPTDNAIVERTIARLEASKAKRSGLVTLEGTGLISVTVRPDCVERTSRILRFLGSAAGQAGIALDATRRPAVWQYEGEAVSFSFEEMADRVAHEPTERELRAVATWEAKRDADFKRYGYLLDYGCPKIPKWEDRHQGRLGVRLEEVRILSDDRWWGKPMRRSFADGSRQDLVDMIPRILATVAAIAVVKRDNRGIEERRRLKQEEEARRWQARQRREALERSRAEGLERLLAEHKRQQQLEAFVEELRRRSSGDGTPRVARLQHWAEERLERWRSQTSGAGLEAWLEAQRLFAEDEDEAAGC